MRRLLFAAGLLILLAGVATAYYTDKHRFGPNVEGSSTEYVPTQTAPTPKPGLVVWPMFGGSAQRLHVAAGAVRPPFRQNWVTGGLSLVEFPPAIGFGFLYYASGNGDLIAVSARNGGRLWTRHVGRCEASSPAVNEFDNGTVFETFLNRKPCTQAPDDGEVLAVTAGRGQLRWSRHIGASETSPLIVHHRLYVGDWEGNVYCLRVYDGGIVWKFHAGGAVKGAIAYDRGRVFFGAYDGDMYALNAATGKLVWKGQSARDLLGRHGTFYSTPAVAYSRVYIGSTDGKVYSFGEESGKVRWSYGTGGYVYGSPAVWDGRVFVGSYDSYFYAFDAATGKLLWKFHSLGPISGSATVVDGVVYFAALNHGRIGRTYGLDARTGKLVWSFPNGAFTPVVTDGKKLFLVGWANVFAFTPRKG